jgi:hypothetical protein
LPVFFSAQEPGDTAAAHADPRRGGTPGAKSTTRTTEIMRQAVLLVRSYLPGGGGSSSGKDCFSIGPIIFLTVWHAAIENKYIFVAVENIDIFYSFFYWGVFLTGPSKIDNLSSSAYTEITAENYYRRKSLSSKVVLFSVAKSLSLKVTLFSPVTLNR